MIHTGGLKREMARATMPPRVGTSTKSHGTVCNACSTRDAMRSRALVGALSCAKSCCTLKLFGGRCASVNAAIFASTAAVLSALSVRDTSRAAASLPGDEPVLLCTYTQFSALYKRFGDGDA